MKLPRHSCGCSNHSQDAEVDVRLALENISRKQSQLADLVAAYMSEAGLDRSARTANALAFAALMQRIVGGRPSLPGTFPECCLIGRRSPNGTQRWFCTGVLVHPRVVLTAAHCSSATSPINIVALQAENFAILEDAEIRDVRRTFVHPNFPLTGNNDIAVLVLRENAATLPVAIASSQDLESAMETTLVGFGNDDLLSTRGFGLKREVEVPILRPENLDEAEQRLGFESDLEFVAGGEGFDSCNGDSGGPAYILVDGARKVAGLTSRGIPGTQNPCGEGGIYTRVDTQITFIRESMQAAGIDPTL